MVSPTSSSSIWNCFRFCECCSCCMCCCKSSLPVQSVSTQGEIKAGSSTHGSATATVQDDDQAQTVRVWEEIDRKRQADLQALAGSPKGHLQAALARDEVRLKQLSEREVEVKKLKKALPVPTPPAIGGWVDPNFAKIGEVQAGVTSPRRHLQDAIEKDQVRQREREEGAS